jgi:hypothetical protein
MAECCFIEADFVQVGSQPTVSVLLDQLSATTQVPLESISNSYVSDPPKKRNYVDESLLFRSNHTRQRRGRSSCVGLVQEHADQSGFQRHRYCYERVFGVHYFWCVVPREVEKNKPTIKEALTKQTSRRTNPPESYWAPTCYSSGTTRVLGCASQKSYTYPHYTSTE